MLMLRWLQVRGGKIIALSLMLTACFGVSLSMAQTCAQLKVAAHPEYPPMAWNSGAGLDGAMIRVIERFARGAKIPLLLEPSSSWEEAQRRTKAGETDLILGLYRTPQREADLLFVDRPIATDPNAVFVRKEQSQEIDAFEDLKPLQGAAVAGESFGAQIDQRIEKELHVSRTDNLTAAMAMLSEKRTDYVLSGLYPGIAFIRRLDPAQAIVMTQASLIPSQPMYAAFSRKSPCQSLAPALDELFHRVANRGDMDGLVAEALVRWSAAQSRK
jgi:polar amino acid transport system substrate-binding protein